MHPNVRRYVLFVFRQLADGAIFANRGATKMLLFVFPTIAPLLKICWALSISLLQIVL
jgi:hypothetical protein